MAKAYGVDAQAVRRHRINCVPEALAKARHAADVRRGDWLIDEGRKLLESCKAVLDRAEVGNSNAKADLLKGLTKEKRAKVLAAVDQLVANDSMVLRAAREVRPTLELLGRLIGQIGETTSVNIAASPDYRELRDTLLKAIEPHKEVWLDISDALNEFEARRNVDPLH
ncbi:MAG: hypothetical protein OEU92_22100 [Alphaproteobacteria bacterium]|nr:hypothetical protein [Alphaproteobacteria bacterium]